MPKPRNTSKIVHRVTSLLPLLTLLACLSQSTAAVAGPNRNHPPISHSTGKLYVVYLDLSSMNKEQRQSFANYLKTAKMPRTAVGEKCIYYGRPQTWCLLLHRQDAAATFIKLKAESFGKAAKVKPANRVGADR